MSRYVILLLLNLPFILFAILTTVAQYKMGRASKTLTIIRTLFWLIILIGLIMAEPLYNWLFTNNLTQTESLSLFDVIQVTAIVVIANIAYHCNMKNDLLEKRVNDLHRELSIRMSKD